ncbi:MAG: hypothetical protein ABSE22_01180 [Xanthobacteraceae bacterium]|jgi:hypothetical protein
MSIFVSSSMPTPQSGAGRSGGKIMEIPARYSGNRRGGGVPRSIASRLAAKRDNMRMGQNGMTEE